MPTAKSAIISRLDRGVNNGKPTESDKNEMDMNDSIHKIKLKFEVFGKPTDETEDAISLDPVTESFTEHESRDLLMHPMVRAFLHLKWLTIRVPILASLIKPKLHTQGSVGGFFSGGVGAPYFLSVVHLLDRHRPHEPSDRCSRIRHPDVEARGSF